MKLVVCIPGKPVPQAYLDTRYETLRKPLGAPKGAEVLPKDDEAVHVWAEVDGRIAAVGRVHLLAEHENGSVVDVQAKSACPAFGPLSDSAQTHLDDNGTMINGILRPAIQVRAMGTLSAFRGMGLASSVLNECVRQGIRLWNARTGWLQARVEAIEFYRKNGWTCFGPEYIIPNVGPHRSMWKKFDNLTEENHPDP